MNSLVMNSIVIREAAATDILDLHRVHAASVKELCSATYGRATAEAWASNPNINRYTKHLGPDFRCLVAASGAIIWGFGSIDLAKSQLAALFVHPEWAGAGVGALLLNALERLAIDCRLNGLSIEASLNARRFYERHGYQSIENRRVRFSTGLEIDCVWMEKSLSA